MFLLVAPPWTLAVWAGDAEEAASVTDPKLRAAINQSIRRGVRYLKKTQRRDGGWVFGPVRSHNAGVTAISLYALAASGVSADDDSIKRGLAWVRKHYAEYGADTPYATYSVSLLVLALARIDAEAHKTQIHRLARRIVKGQQSSGVWGYGLGKKLRGSDISNTQFAVMAIWMAEMHAGYPRPARCWKRIFRLFRDGQIDDGGWGYNPGVPRASASMTAAGLFARVVSEAALAKGRESLPNARKTWAARKGLKRLLEFSQYSNLYFSYGLERAATVMDVDPAKWYVPGARAIVNMQDKQGAWGALARGAGSAYSTSLALLFLTRATRYVITPRRPRPAATTARAPRFPDPVTDRNLKPAFEAYLLSDVAKRIPLRPLFGTAGGACIEFLIGRLADPDMAVRQTAFELLTVLLYKPLLFDPKARADERKIMLAPIRAHWDANKTRYSWNAETQRFER